MGEGCVGLGMTLAIKFTTGDTHGRTKGGKVSQRGRGRGRQQNNQ